MIPFILLCVAIGLATGTAIKLCLDRQDGLFKITRNEFISSSIIISLLIAPLTAFVGFKVAKSNALSFNEYWNGWELAANKQNIPCDRDGPCQWEYNCDPYQVPHTTTDSKGNTTTYYTTEYHDCPYARLETRYTINTTLGEYDLGQTISGYEDRWRASENIPGNIPAGVPSLWTEAKKRLDSKAPGPVTKRMGYKNYILASDTSILKSYSDTIADFKKKKLLPPIVSSIHNHYYADKVSFVGLPNDPAWQNNLMYFNAALGSELQGDLHLVVTKNPNIDKRPDDYITSLKAYWSDPKQFKDDAISKNSIIVVVGTDGTQVKWARAITGMPLGNEEVLQSIKSNIKDLPLDPKIVIGETKSILSKGKVKPQFDGGAIEKTVFGLEGGPSFKRVSMTGEDKDDIGTGFKYLDAQIQPNKGQKIIMFMIVILLTAGMWFAVSYGDFASLKEGYRDGREMK